MINRKFYYIWCLALLGIILCSSVQSSFGLPGLNTVGVKKGDIFNLKVLDNSLDLSALGLSDLQNLGFNLSDIGLENLSFSIHDESINKTVNPAKGDILVANVTELPSNEQNGSISLTLKGVTQNFQTGFFIGTPVTYTNWDTWESYLNSTKTNVNNQGIVTMTLNINSTGNEFKSEIALNFNVPSDYQQYLSSMNIKQVMIYDKTTGIQQMMQVNLTAVSTQLGTINQSFNIVKTDEMPKTTSTTTPTTSTPGFEIITTVFGLIMFTTVIYLSKKGKKSN